MLSLRTMMDLGKARALSIDLGFRVGGDPFRAQIVDGRLEIERADPEGADLAFEGDPSLLASAFYGSQPLEEAEAAGLVRGTGDRALAQRFVDCFRLPAFVHDCRRVPAAYPPRRRGSSPPRPLAASPPPHP